MIELRSRTDSLAGLGKKMLEWMKNGCGPGWLIDTKGQATHVYRPGRKVRRITSFNATLSGEKVLRGFIPELREPK